MQPHPYPNRFGEEGAGRARGESGVPGAWSPRERSVTKLPPPAPGSWRQGAKSSNYESGRPGSNRRRPAWEAFWALAGQGFFGGGSRNGITQYDEGRRAAYGAHATTTRPLGAALPVRGSSVTSSPSGSVASAGSSAMRRALPPASGSTVPSEVHVAPCRTQVW